METLTQLSELITKIGVVPMFIVVIWYLLKNNTSLINKVEKANQEHVKVLIDNHKSTLDRETKVVTLLTEIKELLRENKNIK